MAVKTDPIVDEFAYDLDKVMDKYEGRITAVAIAGVFQFKTIELCLEQQGVNFHRIREALSMLNI